MIKKLILVSIILLFSISLFAGTKVVIKTNYGSIHLELYNQQAPVTVRNFLRYIDRKFYDGTIFHRVMGNFMIQGGGFTPSMNKKQSSAPIKNEAKNGLANSRGTIAMARTGMINSATNQFFINVKNNRNLDHRDSSSRGFGYCVFGRVIKGMDVVDRIRNVRTGNMGHYQNVPLKAVVIKSIRRK